MGTKSAQEPAGAVEIAEAPVAQAPIPQVPVAQAPASVKTGEAPGKVSSSKKNAGMTRAEMNQAAKILNNVTSIVNKNTDHDHEDEVASIHSHESEHHYENNDDHHSDIHDDDRDNNNGFSFASAKAMHRAASGFIQANAPPSKKSTSSAQGNPARSANGNTNSAGASASAGAGAGMSQKAVTKNVKGAEKALKTAKKFLTDNGLKFW